MHSSVWPIVIGIAASTTLIMLMAGVTFAETEVPPAVQAVSVSSEATGQVCSAVTVIGDVASGTCALHASSNGTMDAVSHTIFGETLRARCLNEFEGAVNGSGEGRIGANQISFADPGGGAGIDCTGSSARRACTEMEAAELGVDHQANWHFRTVEDGGGALWIELRMCLMNLDPFNSPVGGNLWFRVTADASGHPTSLQSTDHRLRDAEVPLSADAEFTGGWSLETDATHGGVEVDH
jgi:hypothetical protein